MSDLAQRKRKTKSYYMKCASKRVKTAAVLDKNMKGFFVTCNDRERQCVREAFCLLEEFSDRLYGPEKMYGDKDAETKQPNNYDIEAEVAKEIEMLKKESKAERRFEEVYTATRNCLFIKTRISDPCELAYTILKEIQTKQERKSRFMMRFMPVLATCRAFPPDVKKLAQELLPQFFEKTSPDGKTFAVVFRKRNNNDVNRDNVTDEIAAIVTESDPANKVNLKSPQLTIIVEVVGRICCLSVVQQFYELKKYNISELVETPSANKIQEERSDEQLLSESNNKVSNDTEHKDVKLVNAEEIVEFTITSSKHHQECETTCN